MKNIKTKVILIASLNLMIACGKNPFKSYDEGNVATDATIEIENGNSKTAINLILEDLGSEFQTAYENATALTTKSEDIINISAAINNLIDAGRSDVPNLVSILASAKAQLHGVDPFKLALKFADQSSSNESNSNNNSQQQDTNELTLLFPVLPEATAENIQGLDKALTLLSSLGSYKTASEEYKEALLLTASIALSTKALDSDGDGEISALEAVTLSDAVASVLIEQIAAAVISAAAGDGQDVSASAEQIQKIQSQIDAQEGSTDEEKLRNFIAKSQ